MPGVNVINVATSNHARWQAEKANKNITAARQAQQLAESRDSRSQPPNYFPMVVTTGKQWDSLVIIQRLLRGVIGRNRAGENLHTYVKKWTHLRCLLLCERVHRRGHLEASGNLQTPLSRENVVSKV